MRRLSEKLATLQSRLMTDENHPVHKITSGASSNRRKSAFTLPRKETKSVLNAKRHSLQLSPMTPKSNTRDAEKSGKRDPGNEVEWTAEPLPEVNAVYEAPYPQELNPAASLLHSVCVHSRTLSRHQVIMRPDRAGLVPSTLTGENVENRDRIHTGNNTVQSHNQNEPTQFLK